MNNAHNDIKENNSEQKNTNTPHPDVSNLKKP